MDNYERQLLHVALEALHKLLGHADAQEQFRPALRFADDNVLPFPAKDSESEKKESPGLGMPGKNVGFVEFTEKEIFQMPKQFKTKYRIKRKIVHVRYHQVSANCWTYELRYRADGYNITACGKTIEKAKARFLEKLKTAMPAPKGEQEHDVPHTFTAFALYFFENFRKNKVAPYTYKQDMARMQLHVLPHFAEIPLKKVTPTTCKALIERLLADGKSKTAEEIYSLLTITFKAAILHGIIERNPMQLIPSVQHESEHGEALTKDDEQKLLAALDGTPYQSAFALALYCGLRPNEYKSARIEGEFIVAVNSKRHNRKLEYKRIPICKRLAEYLAAQTVHFPCLRYMRDVVRATLPGHKLYDLRTTFYTRCQELGVESAARDEFVGHSLGALGNTYTDLSNEYLLKEGRKLDNW